MAAKNAKPASDSMEAAEDDYSEFHRNWRIVRKRWLHTALMYAFIAGAVAGVAGMLVARWISM